MSEKAACNKYANGENMKAIVNIPRILRGMKERGWAKRDTCVNCRMNNKTLAKILDGQVPQRLDALYRLLNGLRIPIEEALLNAPAHKTKERSRVYVLPDRREPNEVA